MLTPEDHRIIKLFAPIVQQLRSISSLLDLRSFETALDKLTVAIHEQTDAVRKNTKATDETTKQHARQPPLAGSASVNTNKPIAVTIQGEAKAQIKNPRDWLDNLKLGVEIAGFAVLVGNEGENGRQLQLFIHNEGNSPGTLTLIRATYRQSHKDGSIASVPVTVNTTASDRQAISRETSR
jgi:hypothetical protein